MKRFTKPLALAFLCMMFFLAFAVAPTNTYAATNVSTYFELQTAVSGGDSQIEISIIDSFDIRGTITISAGKTVTISSANSNASEILTRRLGTSPEMFSVESGATLILSDIVLDGNKTPSVSTGAIINNSGMLEIKQGAVLRNNAGNNGGAIYSDGTVNMTGGSITGNEAIAGSGIYNTGGTVNMTGGSMSDNEANSGTISNGDDGTIALSGTAIISGNAATHGAGINNASGTVNMLGGSILDNEALLSGGGISNKGTLTMNGTAVISGNIAQGYGGGIFNNGIANITGGNITGNEAESGAGIDNGGYGTITFGGTAIISENIATIGGGVGNSFGIVEIIGGSIIDNVATSNGGGVFNSLGIINIIGGSIVENIAANNGDGIFNDGELVLGGNAKIGSALGKGNGIYLETDRIIEIESGYTGFSNIEAVADPTLGRVVVQGVQGAAPYTAQNSDMDRFYYLPDDFCLKFDSAKNNIILGNKNPVVNPPETPPASSKSDVAKTGDSGFALYLLMAMLSLVVAVVIIRRTKSKRLN